METFRVSHLSFTYPQACQPALDDVSLSIEQGEFITICGRSGCGKSTLLRQLKPSLAPHGARGGEIAFCGAPLSKLSARDEAARIGFVQQNVDNQIVTDKVWHELAFGLESLGLPNGVIRRRVAEIASFFGIQDWFHKSVTELSGGQRQLLNLASIMAMQPEALILDEPTSQLDPIAAGDFLDTVRKINLELGVTVVMTEHRLEEVLPMSDRAAVLDAGRLLLCAAPREIGAQLHTLGHEMFRSMPTPMRVYTAAPQGECPVTVREGRRYLASAALDAGRVPHDAGDAPGAPYAAELRGVWFRFEKNEPDVLRGLDLAVPAARVTALVGANGAGKTTALSVLAGLYRPYRGSVKKNARRVAMLPQNPQALFVCKSVGEDLLEMLDGADMTDEEKRRRAGEAARLCGVDAFFTRHPYDLSGGEQQRAALAKVLLTDPELLLLDEPTKGMDAAFKDIFAGILKTLTARGVTVLMVSHDIEFCAGHADLCAMFFDGAVVSMDAPRRFFSGNSFYTTAANRMARARLPDAITAEDIILALNAGEEAAHG